MSLSPEGMRRLIAALKKCPPLGPTSFNCRCVPVDLSVPTGIFRLGPPPCHSAERMKDAVDWRIARAETRKIIERMMQA